MPPATRRAGPGPSRRRLNHDSEDDSDGPLNEMPPQPLVRELTEEQKKDNAAIASMADLGSGRRDWVTAVDKGRQQKENLRNLYEERDCNREGTEAASLAVDNKPQLAGWSNFGNTTVAKDGTYEELPDIAGGQSHRRAVAERLREESVLNLGDSYDNRQRRGGVPPPMTIRAGNMFGAARGGGNLGGRGGGAVGRGSSQSGGNRPLDPAIVDGEKDSRYSKGGLQSGPTSRANVKIENATVKITSAPGERRIARAVQARPWPPPALAHLKLADPNDFMAAVSSRTPVVQATSVPPAPAATIKGVSTAVVAEAPIKQASREEFRAPIVSPTSLTEGNPSPVVLQSPSVPSEQEAAMTPSLGLGITGLEQVSNVGRAPSTTIEIEVAILRYYIRKGDTAGLVRLLEPLITPEGRPAPEMPAKSTSALTTPKLASDVEESISISQPRSNPFGAREPVISEASSLPAPLVPKSRLRPKPAPSSTASKGLSESKWATAAPTTGPAPASTALQPKSTNGAVRKSTATDSLTIFGDLRNVSRLTDDDAVRRAKASQIQLVSSKSTAIKRTKPGAGFEALVREMETMKLKQATTATPEVSAALSIQQRRWVHNSVSIAPVRMGTRAMSRSCKELSIIEPMSVLLRSDQARSHDR